MPTADRPLDLTVRRASEADLPAILELARASLGWQADDTDEAFFRWKHLENPAGRSPMWLASSGDAVVGFRVFLRWRFRRPDGTLVRAVRAVDTATHPDHQGRGVFSRLTSGALDDLRGEGTSLVFNTPNDKSRPGYLKMGWQVVGRVPIAIRPGGPAALVRTARARTAATKWSLPAGGGEPASEVLGQGAVGELLDAAVVAPGPPGAPGLATDRTLEHLRWRYRFGPLDYRAVVAPGGPGRGLAIYRVRARGGAREGVLCELLVPHGDHGVTRGLVRAVVRAARADHLLTAGADLRPPGMLPIPGQGPVLTFRAVDPAEPCPPRSAWRLSLGDVELF